MDAKKEGSRIFWLSGAFLLLLLFVTLHCWPEGKQLLEDAVVPGDPAVTRQAFAAMTDRLRTGEAFGDAVAVFCREVMDGAAFGN